MMKKLVLVCALVAGPALAYADPPQVVINDSDATQTVDCGDGGSAVINGGDNTITFTGGCARIVINGGDNKVAIAGVDRIQVNGGGNKVTYQHGWKKKSPKVVKLGSGNKVSKVK